MDEDIFIALLLIAGLGGAVFNVIKAKATEFRSCFIALVALPVILLVFEFAFVPSSLDGVTSLTGVFTIMFTVVWLPLWIVTLGVGWWLEARNAEA